MQAKDNLNKEKHSREKIVATWLSCSPSSENVVRKSTFGCRLSEPALHKKSTAAAAKGSKSDTGLSEKADEFGLTWSEYGFGDRIFIFKRGESGCESFWSRPILSDQMPVKTYLARWYVLVTFSIFALTQYCLWNTFGPISETLKKGFHWSKSDIAMLANWDTILYIAFAIQICWIVEQKGIRNSVIGSVFCSVVGSGLRCITSDPEGALWAMNAGQFMNGLAGTVAQAIGPVISMVWFPPGERATATAVSSLFASLGVAVSFAVGPLLVQDPVPFHGKPINNHGNSSKNINGSNQSIPSSIVYRPEEYRGRVMFLLYSEFGFSFLLLLLVVAYFPNKPPHPPSKSAGAKRLNFQQGWRKIIRLKSFWLLVFVGASTTGVYSGWYALLAVNFNSYGLQLTETDAGWIGCYSILAGIIGGLIMGRVVDICTRRIKLCIALLYFFATLSFTWVTLMCLKLAPYTLGNLYQACMVGGFCIAGSVPLLYEFVIEMTYPIPETVSIGILTLMNNMFTFVFLLALSIPSISTKWMNLCLVSVCALALPLLIMLRGKYNRLDLDQKEISVLSHDTIQASVDSAYSNSISKTLSQEIIHYTESTGSLYVNQSHYSTNTIQNISSIHVDVEMNTFKYSESIHDTEETNARIIS